MLVGRVREFSCGMESVYVEACMTLVFVIQGSGCNADKHTYASLIDACARVGRTDLAIRVYHKALRERLESAPLVYSSAIAACRAARPVDITTAMDIFRDMQR